MTKNKTTNIRRKAIKSMAAGASAVVAGKALPNSWGKPVVDAVMLPAHANTTDTIEANAANLPIETTTTEAFICRPVVLPSLSMSCDTELSSQFGYILFNDSGACPASAAPNSGPATRLQITVTKISTILTASFSIDGSETGNITLDCSNEGTTPAQVPFSEIFQGLSGNQWIAIGSFIRTATSVGVSDVTVLPS